MENNIQAIQQQLDLGAEVSFIARTNTSIDGITISAKDAATIISVKNDLARVAESLNQKNTIIAQLFSYINELETEKSKTVNAKSSPIVNTRASK